MKKFKYILILFFIILSTGFTSTNTKPVIKIITPQKSESYIISRPTIKANFYDKVEIKDVKLYLNNKDVTKNAKINKNSIIYKPNKMLKRGTQVVKVVVSNKHKNTSTIEWYFTVGTPKYKIFKGIDFCYSSKGSPKQINLDFKNLKLDESAILYILDFKKRKITKNNIYKTDEISCILKSSDISTLNYMNYFMYKDKIINQIDIAYNLNLYNEALDNGWHVSPFSFENTNYILSSDLNKRALFDGLSNNRTYTSENENIHLEFSVNSKIMGSIIKNPKSLNFNICIVDQNPSNKIKAISIISNRKIIKNIESNSNLEKIEFTLNEFEKPSYYYLIIEQIDKKRTISSPIWVD